MQLAFFFSDTLHFYRVLVTFSMFVCKCHTLILIVKWYKIEKQNNSFWFGCIRLVSIGYHNLKKNELNDLIMAQTVYTVWMVSTYLLVSSTPAAFSAKPILQNSFWVDQCLITFTYPYANIYSKWLRRMTSDTKKHGNIWVLSLNACVVFCCLHFSSRLTRLLTDLIRFGLTLFSDQVVDIAEISVKWPNQSEPIEGGEYYKFPELSF